MYTSGTISPSFNLCLNFAVFNGSTGALTVTYTKIA